MATIFENVILSSLNESGQIQKKYDSVVRIALLPTKPHIGINILSGTQVLGEIKVSKESEVAKIGETSILLTSNQNFIIKLHNENDTRSFHDKVRQNLSASGENVFNKRTDPASAEQYFQFYSYLSQQQNMMQDYIRTSTYQRSMLGNIVDFQDKVVLDVGAGSGILSFFAIQAGARKVYAVEASDMAQHCEQLVHNNKLSGKIEVIAGIIEEIKVPEQVDVIISEPMGYMLFNERMLESYLHAKKWLKPGGVMFPTQGDLHIAPFTDDSLYMEQFSKANFWYQPSFHGVDLQCLREAAVREYFRQPVVDTFDIRICMSKAVKHTVDFSQAHETDLHTIDIPLAFHMLQSGTVHGLAFWFDVAFRGSQQTIWLSTAPTQPLTHWYQVRCLLQQPIFVRQGQTLTGRVLLRSNSRQSYDVDIELTVPGTSNKSSNTLDLKNPFFRYTGQQPAQPPGTNTVSPSDTIWGQDMDTHSAQYAPYNMTVVNGGSQENHNSQLGVAQHNLVPLANSGQGSPASQAMATRTSVGGGISPALFNQGTSNLAGQLSISNQFMIGDYAVPGNVVLPNQGLAATNLKS